MTTKKCPKCKEHDLLWHCIHGIRLKREDENGKMGYDVRCPKCGDFTLPAPKRG